MHKVQSMAVFVNIIYSIMAKKESKILEELRRKGKIFEDPAPQDGGIIGRLIDLFSKKK